MSSSDRPVAVRDLTKRYRSGWFKSGFAALRAVDLEVERGSVFGLLGPNGAGKTTLIKVLLGLAPRYEGSALVLGRPPREARVRERIGYLPEAHRLPGYLTGRQVLMLYGMYAGKPAGWLRQRIPAWLERVEMTQAADRKVREYSKGMQQRIGLVQALLHEPELVFLDEPTDGIDPVGRATIRAIVAELRERGATVFINSHLLLEVEQMCDRVVIMSRGEILREGSIEELTPRTGRVSVELAPSTDPGRGPAPAELAQTLAGLGSDFTPDARGFELTLSQDELDGVVDRLRAAGVSIRAVTPRRLSLEEAFIGLFREEAGS